MGKSASGKDTLARTLLSTGRFNRLTPCTTRPMRKEEKEGDPYHFILENDIQDEMIAGEWFTRTDGSYCYGFSKKDLQPDKDYLTVASPAQIKKLLEEYGGIFNIIIIEIKTDEEKRILHAIEREDKNDRNYAELCRRIRTDAFDFSAKNSIYNFIIDNAYRYMMWHNDYNDIDTNTFVLNS